MNSYKEPAFNIQEPAPFYLCVLLVLIHAAMVIMPESISGAVKDAGLLAAIRGDYMLEWRPLGNVATLLLHGFLHGEWGHVVMNSFCIFIFGTLICRVAGRKKLSVFLLIFLGGVIIGGLFQWAWWAVMNDTASALGASGGASALFAGGAWVLGGKQRLMQWGIVFGIINVIMVVSSQAQPGASAGIAWAAHIGGYVGGAIFAAILLPPRSASFGMIR